MGCDFQERSALLINNVEKQWVSEYFTSIRPEIRHRIVREWLLYDLPRAVREQKANVSS